MITAKITRNGQITVPKKIREQRNWRVGEVIKFEDKPDGVFLESISNDQEELAYLDLLNVQMSDWADPINDDLFAS